MARHISGNNLACRTTEKLRWVLGFVRFRIEWFMHSRCYLWNRGVACTTKIGFASVTDISESLFFSFYWFYCRALAAPLLYSGWKDVPLNSQHSMYICSFLLVCENKSTSKDSSWISLLFQMLVLIIPLHFMWLYKCNWESRVCCPFLKAVKAFCSEE